MSSTKLAEDVKNSEPDYPVPMIKDTPNQFKTTEAMAETNKNELSDLNNSNENPKNFTTESGVVELDNADTLGQHQP